MRSEQQRAIRLATELDARRDIAYKQTDTLSA